MQFSRFGKAESAKLLSFPTPLADERGFRQLQSRPVVLICRLASGNDDQCRGVSHAALAGGGASDWRRRREAPRRPNSQQVAVLVDAWRARAMLDGQGSVGGAGTLEVAAGAGF